MVRCLRDPATCPDSAHVDCDGDGSFDLDDVLCCARVILRGRIPAGVPARLEPDLQVSMEAAVTTATGIDMPVRIQRADLIGAAHVHITRHLGTQGSRLTELARLRSTKRAEPQARPETERRADGTATS